MTNDRFGSPPTDAPFPWRAIFVVLAAALLVVWVTGPKGRLANDPDALSTICKSFGKGGALCAPEAAADKQAAAKPDPDPACTFRYRAGVSCPTPIAK